jgi:hypothetical protein
MRKSSRYYYKRKRKFSFVKFALQSVSIFFLIFIFVILITPTPYYKDGFKNLKELQTYANQTDEQTPMENTDTLKPEFTKYYRSLVPTFSQKIKNKINLLLYLVGIGEKPVWSISFFKTALETTTKIQQQAGYEGNLIYKIQTEPASKFVIFGNMQGAFHSLVRCLTKIKELGIIGEDLKMCSPNNYIIFMGDVIDRSPFTLEILSALVKLVEINPQNVIYLRGNHESNDYWKEHTLKTELQIRAADFAKNGSVPLEKEVNAFFNTLPLAVYLSIPNSQTEFIRISEASRAEGELLNEGGYAGFLKQQPSSKLSHFVIKEKSAAQVDPSINIKVIVKNEKKRKSFQKMEGLRLLTPDMGSVAWNVLSCPTPVYQKALDFYNDAFALISASEKLEDWDITLYSHDVRTKEPFKETKFNFLSGLDLQTYKARALQAPKQPVPAQKPHVKQVVKPVAPVTPQVQVIQPATEQEPLPQIQQPQIQQPVLRQAQDERSQPQIQQPVPQIQQPVLRQAQDERSQPQIQQPVLRQAQDERSQPQIQQPEVIVPEQQTATETTTTSQQQTE